MFDATFRLLIDDFPKDWHDWLCATAGVSRDVELVELDTDLGTVGARADKLYRAGDELLHFEVQPKSERTLPDRSLLYNVRASHRHGGPVRAVLICRAARPTPRR